MPGVDLNLPIPSLSDTQTQVVTKTAQALTLIDADLAAAVLPSEININSALSFNGNPATNVGYVTLGGGTPGAVIPGTMYYNNGEWFLVDSTGTIQITSNGFINVSGTGGIGGDYIAVGALVSYNSAGSKYIFFGNGAVSIVDIDVRKVILEGAGPATVTIGVDASLVTNKVVNFKSLPTVNVGLLAYDAAAQAIVDGSTVAITQPTTFTGLTTFNGVPTFNAAANFAAGFTGTDHNTYTKEIPFTLGPTSNNVSLAATDQVLTSATGTWLWRSEPYDLTVGEKVTSLLLRLSRAVGNANIAAAVKKRNVVTGAVTTVNSNTYTSTGAGDLTVTVASPTAIASRERWYAEVSGDTTGSGGLQDAILGAAVTWTA